MLGRLVGVALRHPDGASHQEGLPFDVDHGAPEACVVASRLLQQQTRARQGTVRLPVVGGDLTGPGGAAKGNPFYEFLGVKRYWAHSKENMNKSIEATQRNFNTI